jgi:DNA-binding transcriptional regulator LsrR (DeoR family)
MSRKSVLTPEEMKKIIRLYSRELMTQAMLARRFGVSQSTVRDVLLRANIEKPSRRLDVR